MTVHVQEFRGSLGNITRLYSKHSNKNKKKEDVRDMPPPSPFFVLTENEALNYSLIAALCALTICYLLCGRSVRSQTP